MPNFLGHDAKYFFLLLLRYVCPQLPNGREKSHRIFKKISVTHGAAVFGFRSHSQRGATAFWAVAPLDYPSARTGAAVNGGAFCAVHLDR